jgi:hypothetical protein
MAVHQCGISLCGARFFRNPEHVSIRELGIEVHQDSFYRRPLEHAAQLAIPSQLLALLIEAREFLIITPEFCEQRLLQILP